MSQNPVPIRREPLSLMCRLFATVLILIMTAGLTRAQTKATDGSTPAGLTPGAPAGSYSLSGFDNVNLYNGSLNFRLPLVSVGGRGGAGHTVLLPVERHWMVEQYDDGMGGVYNYPVDAREEELESGYGPGVMHARYGATGKVTCNDFPPPEEPRHRYLYALTRLAFTGPDGTEYEFRDQLTGGQKHSVGGNCNATGFNRGKVFVSIDGSAATFISDSDVIDPVLVGGAMTDYNVSGYLKLRDGSVYRVDGGLVSWLRDRNGNKVAFAYDANRRVTAITDSLNRQVTVAYDVSDVAPYGLCDKITYKGFNGAQRVIRVSKASLGTLLRAGFALQTPAYLFPGIQGSNYSYYNPTVVSAVWLPNGKSYQFQYDSHAELSRVTLPTGGAYEYDFAPGTTNGYGNGVVYVYSDRPQIYRRVMERRVYSDGANLTSRMTYSRPETEGGTCCAVSTLGYVVAEARDASGTLLAKTQHYFHGSGAAPTLFQLPTTLNNWQEGKEYQADTYDTNGTTVLRRVVNSWQVGTPISSNPSVGINGRIWETVSTVEPAGANQVSGQTISYDQFNNQTDVYDYDFGSGVAGSLIRRTHTDYLTTNAVNGADYASPSPTVSSVHLRSLPSRASVYDAAGVEQARTTFEYDNHATDSVHAPLVSRANISGFDAAFNVSYQTRGNATATTRYLLTNGTVTGSVSAYQQYDVAGSVVKAVDPRGYQTTFDFADRYGSPDAEARSNTQPAELGAQSSYAFASLATNAAGHTAYTQFDYYTGRPVNVEDANGVVSGGFYSDTLDRLTQAVQAYGTAVQSQTTFSYDDTGRVVTTTSDLNAYGDNLLKSQSLYDQLGRTFETRQYESSTDYIAVRRAYDTLGRVNQVSNPFRPWQGESPVWTTTQFDALGRTTLLTTPDGAQVVNAYSGTQVTATDQMSRSRRTTSDALGRLKQVTEDPAGLAYVTSYTYDVLGNLRAVAQGSQSRYFMYDSLSRLVRAKNPEQAANGSLALTDPLTSNSQWSLAYGYDANGNLLTKTDARGVSVTYVYDALNRNTTADYSDTATDPDVTRTYDSAPNGKGRLRFSYAGGNYSAGTTVEHTAFDSYDAVGRPLVMRQYFKTAGVWGGAFEVQRAYNLAGGVISQTYPSGRTVAYQYDAAGRLNDFRGNLGDGVQRVYSTGIQYTSAGALKQEQFGTDTPVYNKLTYNVRRQLSEVRVGTTPNDTFWNRGAIINHYSDQSWAGSGTDNNGTLKKQDVYIPNDDAITGYSLTTQFYNYDALNRLDWMREVRNGANSFVQDYTIDRYGNRTIDPSSWGGVPEPQYGVDAATNRLTAPAGYTMTYDPAGYLTYDNYNGGAGGGTRAYDAEGRMTQGQFLSGQLQTAVYSYDADGQRVRRNMGAGGEVWQVYGMSGELLAEYAANASPASTQKEYGYRGGGLLVTAEAGAQVRWLVSDQLGTPRMVVDKSGSLSGVKRNDYLPYGEELYSGVGGRTTAQGYAWDGVRQQFTGYERDAETGLDFAQARYYSSSCGRFTSPDPLAASGSIAAPQTWNRYAYVGNDPVGYADPSGMIASRPGSPQPGGITVLNGTISNGMGGHQSLQQAPGTTVADRANAAFVNRMAASAVGRFANFFDPPAGGAQAAPTITNATPGQTELIAAGIGEATKLLDNEPCAVFFGGKENGTRALTGLNPYIDPTMSESGHPQGEMRENGLAINPHGTSFVTPNDGSYTFYLYLPGNYAKYTLTLSGVTARAFALLHEGAHKGGRFGATDDDSLSNPITFNNGFVNNYKIWKACFSDFTPKLTKTLPPFPGIP